MSKDTSSAPPPPPSPPAAPAVSPPVPAPPGRRSWFVRWAVWCAAGGIAVAAAYFGTGWWTYRSSHSITDDAFVEAHIVNVAPEMVSGRIVRFHVEENDRVKQGQVLAEIDSVHYQDQVDLAKSKLATAQAELRRQEASLARLRKEVPLQIEVAKRSLAAARADQARTA